MGAERGEPPAAVTSRQLDHVTHALGVAVGMLRAEQASLQVEDAAAIQQVHDRAPRLYPCSRCLLPYVCWSTLGAKPFKKFTYENDDFQMKCFYVPQCAV